MSALARQLTYPLLAAAAVLFAAAAIAESNPLYGVSLATFAAGLACFFAWPLSPHARSPLLAHGGLALAVGAALVDSALDFADEVGTGTSICFVLMLVGCAAAFLGRTTGGR
jgi:hypothetical protein